MSARLAMDHRMRCLVRVLFVALVVGERALAATAASGDPLHAPECQRALAALDAVEGSASAPLGHGTHSVPHVAASGANGHAAPAIDPRVTAARRDVARQCLEAREDPPRAGRLAEPAIEVPPVAGARATPSTPPTTMPARIPPVQPPVVITTCDTGGCWTSDGQRLPRLGPTLLGPRGQACSVVGAVVHCP
jgi:hypothetical protein